MNPNRLNSKQDLPGHLKLEFGAYWKFDIWNFACHGFYIPTNFCFLNSILLRALMYALALATITSVSAP